MSKPNMRTHTLIRGRWYPNTVQVKPLKINGKSVIDLHLWTIETDLYWTRHIIYQPEHYKSLRNDFFKERFEDEGTIVFVSSVNVGDEYLLKAVEFIARVVRNGNQELYRLD